MKEKLMTIVNGIDEDEIFSRAAALAYYTALAIAPLMILMVSFLSTIDLSLQNQLIAEVNNLVGSEAARLMETIIAGAKERPDLSSVGGWVGAGGLLISASIIFVQLQNTLNLIFDAKPEELAGMSRVQQVKTLLMRRLFSIGMLLTFVFIAIVSLVVSSSLNYFLGRSNLVWLELVNTLVSLSIFALLFSIIFKWMPDRKLSLRSSVIGGVLTAALFVAGKYLISLYIGKTAVGSAYGAAGSLVVLLVWVYYSSLIVFLGAEVSYALFYHEKKVVEEEPAPPKRRKKVYVGIGVGPRTT